MLLISRKSSIFFANSKLFGQKFADFKFLSYLCTHILINAAARKQFWSRSLAE